MPTVPDDFVPVRANSPQLDQVATDEDPGVLDTLKAAGVVANWPFRLYRYAQNRADAATDIDHNPFDVIKGTRYESQPERFAFSHNMQETQAIMKEWDDDESARDTLARSGWSGTVAGIGMGMLDPTLFLPVVKVFSGAAQGLNALRIGADAAVAGAAAGAIGESAMLATTPDYTIGEAALGVGTSTILSGLIGTGAGALMSRAERKSLETSLQADREDWGRTISQPQSAGAATADTRSLELNTPEIMKKLPDITAKISPPRRVLNSGFVSARRAVADLVETPYIFRENIDGVATTQGPALDRLVKLETGKSRVAISKTFDELYTNYRFGDGGASLPERLATGAQDLIGRPRSKANFTEFKELVSDAMRNGDVHDIPQVQKAAQFLRKEVFDPWKDKAIKAGLLREDVDVSTADSYLMRVWNKQKLIADRPNVVKTFADWYEAEQAKKASSRERIAGMQDLLEQHTAKMDELEAAITSRIDAMALGEARLSEAQLVNKQAFSRSTTLRDQLERLADEEVLTGRDNGSALSSVRDNARGGVVFETRARNRQNILADRIQGVDAQVDDLTRRLADMTARHDNLRADIEKEILAWEGKSSREARAALKAREAIEVERQAKISAGEYNGKGGRLTSADSSVSAAVRRILATERDLSRQEIDSIANETVNRIVGSPDGRLPYDATTGGPRGGVPGPNAEARGPLANRTFMIPDNLVRDYLENDVQHIAETYLNTMVPDVLLTEKFGDVDMTDVFRRVNDERSSREMAASTEAERLKIDKEFNSVVADLAAMRDRIRHTYGYSSDPRQRLMGRIAATAARYDIVTNLGGSALSSLSDLAGIQWRHGFSSTFKNAWLPMLKAITNKETRKALKQYRSQLQALSIAAETYTSTRTTGVYDVLDLYRPTSRFERGMNVMADKFGLASLLTPWTDFGKFAAGMVSGSELAHASEAMVAGQATKRQIRNLAEAGIDGPMADRIWRELSSEGGSDVVDGIRIPNSGNWQDVGARDAFEGALARDVDIMILTPGAEKPLMMSDPVKALILQYKTFVAAANERILVRSLQARDAQVLQGAASAVALGVLAEYAYSIAANRDAPATPQDWIKAGVNRSGILGWYQEGNSIAAKWTGGTADAFRLIGAGAPDARYISRSPGGALLGPTFGKAESTVKVMSKLVAKVLGGDVEWNASDTTQMRRMLAGQNLFYIRRLLDAGEREVNDAIGVENKP